MFGTLCKLSRSFNTARDFFWAAMIWGSRASNFDDCPKIVFHVCPQNFQETLKKKWSPAISILKNCISCGNIVFVLFYASQCTALQWCSEAWQLFFVIVDCQVVKHWRKDGLKLIKYFRHLWYLRMSEHCQDYRHIYRVFFTGPTPQQCWGWQKPH